MAPSILATATSGAIFGAALTAAGVYSPSCIIGQLRLENLHMLEVFMTVTAGSAIVMATAHQSSYAPCGPRNPSTLGSFKYGSNILGGLMQGCGMALSGACAGTVLVQVATGVASGLNALFGAALGGIAYARWGNLLKSPAPKTSASALTVHESAGVREGYGVVLFDVMCISVALGANKILPSTSPINPFVAGLLITGAQAASVLLTTNMLGVSTAYEQIGLSFWHVLDITTGKSKLNGSWPATSSIVFGGGIIGGSLMLQNVYGWEIVPETIEISTVRGVLGGFLLGFGSRVSGGCTSGHGISGMSTLSKSSFITVAGMFGGGMLLVPFLV